MKFRSLLQICSVVVFLTVAPAFSQETAATPQSGTQTQEVTGNEQAKDRQEVAREAAEVVREMTQGAESRIPPSILESARAVAVVPDVIKGAFIAGGRFGEGLMATRKADGSWSNTPSYVELSGASAGFQAGVTESDLVFFFMTQEAVESILDGKLELGGEIRAVAGPHAADASVDTQTREALYTYSRSGGLFAGISVTGAHLTIDSSANREVYGTEVTARELLVQGTAQPQMSGVVQPFIEAVRGIEAGGTAQLDTQPGRQSPGQTGETPQAGEMTRDESDRTMPDQTPQDTTGQPQSRDSSVSISDIRQNPEQFVGKEVTIAGEVESVWGDRTLRVGGEEFYGDEMIVTARMPIPKVKQRGERNVLRDDLILASGTVKTYQTIDEAKAELGRLSAGFESAWTPGQPILVADTVLIIPRKQETTAASEQNGATTPGSSEDRRTDDQSTNRQDEREPSASGQAGALTPDRSENERTTGEQMTSDRGAKDAQDFRSHVGQLIFSRWDTNNDNQLNADEVRQGLESAGYLQKWDTTADGKLDAQEIAYGLTQALDKDNDNRISLTEYQAGWAHLTGEVRAEAESEQTTPTGSRAE